MDTRNLRNTYYINLCKVGGKNPPDVFYENAPILDNKRQSSQNFHTGDTQKNMQQETYYNVEERPPGDDDYT